MNSLAAETPSPPSSDAIPLIKKKLAALLPPNTPIKSIGESGANGLYEIVAGGEVFYATRDGRFLIVGDLLSLDRPSHNLTEIKKGKIRLQILNQVQPKTFLTFKAQNEKHHLFVFTDVDCGFCRKLHNEEVPKLNKKGVTVHYLAFPRAGQGSETYKTMVSIWCANKPTDAMTSAKQGKPIPPKTCAHPIDQHLKLVQTLNLTGTPAIILEDGRLISGYQPAEQLYP
ncbi:MAG: DsbC family protein [Gammaproteobacteria bacterium]|nr:DsbC family protein [Gammaproteobacteria bacterium]